MPKYLFEADYTPEGVRGLKDAGAASRSKAVDEMVTALGGSLESFHFAFGDVDAYVVVDLPDDEAAGRVYGRREPDDEGQDHQAPHPRGGRRRHRPIGQLPPAWKLTYCAPARHPASRPTHGAAWGCGRQQRAGGSRGQA